MTITEIECVRCKTKYPKLAINPQTGLCPLCDKEGSNHPYIERLWF